MKHLRFFESRSDIPYHKRTILDIFQDIIDDYNIERYNSAAMVDDISGIYYILYDILDEDKFKLIYLKIFLKGDRLQRPEFYLNKVEFVNNLELDKKRLEMLGYKVRNYRFGYGEVEIEIDYSNT